MSRAIRPLKMIVVFLLIFAGAWAQVPVPALDRDGAGEIDALLQRAVKQGAVPGVVAVVANKDGILYEGAFGLMDVARRKPMRKDAIFRIASMTKPVTAVAVMMLIEQGKLSLDDPVSKYIPSFRNRETIASYNPADGSFTTKKTVREPRIRDLLSNTSGLSYTFANDQADRVQKKLNKPSDELPFLYDPGTKWTYGPSSKVLGTIVEKITGTRLDKVFDQQIFAPLGLQDTSYAVPASRMDRVPTTHQRTKGKLIESANPKEIQWGIAGDGGLNATAQDYIKFLQMFLNNGKVRGKTLLTEDSIRAMTANQIGNVIVQKQVTIDPSWSQSFPIGAGRDRFGFGFQITSSNAENPDLRSPGSYTWAGIFNTHFWVDPRRKIAAVIMMQVLPFYDDECIKLYQDFEAAVGRKLQTQ